MKTRFLKTAGLAFVLVPSVFFSQNNISGTVTSSSGEPLIGATIRIENTYLGTTTRQDGKYVLSGLTDQSYLIKVSYVGYETQSQHVQINGKDVVLDFRLTLDNIMADELTVTAIKAGDNTPTTFTNLSKTEIEAANFGQDLTYLLDQTPSTVVTSDAGAGIGYTGVRIRGVDPTRTNVTVNGIPINDAESHGVFWVNMPDFTSSANTIQIQRGVGTSTNGAAAFGASINIQSNETNDSAYAEINNTFGSFQTLRHTVKLGTGIINNKFSIDGRLSKITSNGYIDRAASDLKSYYLSGAYYLPKSTIRATLFSGKEITYQAWYGTPESRINGDTAAMNAYADRNWLTDAQRNNLLTSGRTYNFYTYDNEVDHYQQDHYHLHFNHRFSDQLNVQLAGHYTKGRGYFEQYREGDDFSTYGFDPIFMDSTTTITNTDLIRRRWLDNQFYGGIFSLNYQKKNLSVVAGGGANIYDGDHFGEVIWARNASQSEIRDRYYDNNGRKEEASFYVKSSYNFSKLTTFIDLQYRYINYSFLGIDDVNGAFEEITQNVSYSFFNPKVGALYQLNNKNKFYGSLSIGNREPVRTDLRESSPESRPVHETLFNVEVGHQLKMKKFLLNSNLYMMEYKNQLVLTGQINDVGAYNRTNVPVSYRRGIELEGVYQINDKIHVGGNLNLSTNKLPEFTEYIDDYDNGGQAQIIHSNTDIAFSPNIIVGGNLTYKPIKNLDISLLPKHVGKQYLDNTQNESRKIDAYTIAHFRVNYTIENFIGKELNVGLLINNITNLMYENNGYTFSYIAGGATTTENFYYPQAGRNFLINLSLKL